jgi:hypothetical protein
MQGDLADVRSVRHRRPGQHGTGHTARHRRCTTEPTQATIRARPRARTLAELPPAALILSVDRRIDGCREPVIVRYGIGARR